MVRHGYWTAHVLMRANLPAVACHEGGVSVTGLWLDGLPIAVDISHQIEEFCGVSFTSTNQQVDTTNSRMKIRDNYTTSLLHLSLLNIHPHRCSGFLWLASFSRSIPTRRYHHMLKYWYMWWWKHLLPQSSWNSENNNDKHYGGRSILLSYTLT